MILSVLIWSNDVRRYFLTTFKISDLLILRIIEIVWIVDNESLLRSLIFIFENKVSIWREWLIIIPGNRRFLNENNFFELKVWISRVYVLNLQFIDRMLWLVLVLYFVKIKLNVKGFLSLWKNQHCSVNGIGF